MKKYIFLVLLIAALQNVSAQVKFIERYEIPAEADDPLFKMVESKVGLVSFRILPEKGSLTRRNLQYFISDSSLQSAKGIIEFPIRNGFELQSYDIDGNFLVVLFSEGFDPGASKYLLQVNLGTNEELEFEIGNVLDMKLGDLLFQDQKVIFMGTAQNRPVIQLFDLQRNTIQTLQGIYGNNTQIIQLQKVAEFNSLNVLLSRTGLNGSREIFINTYNMAGVLIREIKVDEFVNPEQKILDGMLVSSDKYQEAMIGSFGLVRQKDYLGMYILGINEFSETDLKQYTLQDFPNFYNYLDEKNKAKYDKRVQKELDKNGIPDIKSLYTISSVRQTDDAYFVYFDHYSATTSRSENHNARFFKMGGYRYDRWGRIGTARILAPSEMNANIPGTYQISSSSIPEYKYISAHFAKVSKSGEVLWDNATSYDEMLTNYPETYGDIALDGEDLYHMYVEDRIIKLSFFRNGKKIFENKEFELGLINEEERIRDSNVESFRLIHWYERYYLLSGTQQIRSLDENGMEEVRLVYFLTKIEVDGNLYNPEKLAK